MSDRPGDSAPCRTGNAGLRRSWWWLLARTGDPVAKLLEPGFRGDAYALYERMRAEGPVHRSRTGMLAVLSYDCCGQVLRDPRFSACEPLARPTGMRAPTSPAAARADGPSASRVKRRPDQAYAAAVPLLEPALRRSAARIDTAAQDLLRQRADTGSIDLIDDFAFPLVVFCLGEVLGIPSADSARFAAICDVIGRPVHGTPSTVRAGAVRDANEDLAALVIRLKHEPPQSPGGDLISRLTASPGGDRTGNDDLTRLIDHIQRRDCQETPKTRAAGEPGATSSTLGLEEIAEVCRELIASSLDTATALIGNAVAALTAHPGQWQTLRSAPQLVAKAVEETLRFDPPRQFTLRIPSERVEVGGHTMPPGSGVLVMLAAAHRDFSRFPAPARFDLTRGSGQGLLAADGAIGLGMSLARLTGEVALRTLASRLPRLRPAGRAVRRPGGAVRGFVHYEVRL